MMMISTTATRIALRRGGCRRMSLAASMDTTTTAAASASASASPLSTPATSPSPAATLVGGSTFPCTQQLRSFSVRNASPSMQLIARNDFTTSSVCHRQWFSTTGGGDGDDNTNKPSGEGDDSTDESNDAHASAVTVETPESSVPPLPPPPATTTMTIDDENYTTPAGIMSTFEDTSYYHPIELPAELSATYAHMTNEELQDSSTIPGWDMLIHSPPTRGTLPKGALVGKVVSTKMMKTINVAVDRYKTHKKYKKRLRYTRKFMAHDEREVAKDGDTVLIVPCQRLSKHKHFMLNQIITPKGQL